LISPEALPLHGAAALFPVHTTAQTESEDNPQWISPCFAINHSPNINHRLPTPCAPQ